MDYDLATPNPQGIPYKATFRIKCQERKTQQDEIPDVKWWTFIPARRRKRTVWSHAAMAAASNYLNTLPPQKTKPGKQTAKIKDPAACSAVRLELSALVQVRHQ